MYLRLLCLAFSHAEDGNVGWLVTWLVGLAKTLVQITQCIRWIDILKNYRYSWSQGMNPTAFDDPLTTMRYLDDYRLLWNIHALLRMRHSLFPDDISLVILLTFLSAPTRHWHFLAFWNISTNFDPLTCLSLPSSDQNISLYRTLVYDISLKELLDRMCTLIRVFALFYFSLIIFFLLVWQNFRWEDFLQRFLILQYAECHTIDQCEQYIPLNG